MPSVQHLVVSGCMYAGSCWMGREARAQEAEYQARINGAIERDLEQWKKDYHREIKLLLLGECLELWCVFFF